MILSLAVIVVLMLVTVGATGLCSYEPGAPENGPVREVDAHTFMGLEARAASHPLRMPENPEGWVTNSARRGMVAEQPAAIVGWVTAEGGFIQLTQTSVPLDEAVREIDPDPRDLARTVTVAGQDVQVYQSEERDVRDLWAVDMGETTLLFTGAAPDEEFLTIIEDTVTAEPLPSS